MSNVYITHVQEFLPNSPIENEDMEDYLGQIKNKTSRSKNIILRSNKINTRYYALTKEGKTTHTNAEMTVQALKKVLDHGDISADKIDILSCGTSTPDQMMPAHGYMVQGEMPSMSGTEVVTVSGNCCSSMQALKYACMAIRVGDAENAVVTGSERNSKLMRSEKFEEEAEKLMALENAPVIAFEKDFLRWMLSDGASAVLLQNKPAETGLSFKVDWVKATSFASDAETCMYMAAEKNDRGELISFKEFTPKEVMNNSIMSMKQDVRLLDENIVKLGFQKLHELFKDGTIDVDQLTYFVPHMSSFYFQDKIAKFFEDNDINLPYEKWFTNLPYKGNIGAASIFSMLAELQNEKDLSKGDQLLIAVPESARFSYVFAKLTVV